MSTSKTTFRLIEEANFLVACGNLAPALALYSEALASVTKEAKFSSDLTSDTKLSSHTPPTESNDSERSGLQQLGGTHVILLALNIEENSFPASDEVWGSYIVILYNIARVFLFEEDLLSAKTVLETSLGVIQALGVITNQRHIRGPTIIAVLATLNNIGHVYLGLNMIEDALRLFSEAVCIGQPEQRTWNPCLRRLFTDCFSTAQRNHDLALCIFADLCERNNMVVGAIMAYAQILKVRQANSLKTQGNNETHLMYSRILYRMGTLHFTRQQLDLAIKSFQLSLKYLRQALGDSHEEVADLIKDIGIVELHAGRHSVAIESFGECLRLRRRHLGVEHEATAEILYVMGRVHQEKGAYDHAIQALREALNIERSVAGSDTIGTAVILFCIAHAHLSKGHKDNAVGATLEALDIVRRASVGDANVFAVQVQLIAQTILFENKSFGNADILWNTSNTISSSASSHYNGSNDADIFNVEQLFKAFGVAPYCAVAA